MKGVESTTKITVIIAVMREMKCLLFERKLILNENENKYCDGCGHETKSNQIYCSECGKLLSQVGKRRKN